MNRPFVHLLLVLTAAWAGCSPDRASVEGGARDFGSIDGGVDGVDGGCSGLVCSRDLRSVRDCSGSIVRECEADRACGKGECVAPCEAAAANEGSIGCSFAIPTPIEDGSSYGSCSAVFVANTWNAPATVRFSYKGEEQSTEGAVWVPFVEDGALKHRKLEGPIPPGSGAVVFVSNQDPGAESNYWVECPLGVKPILAKALTLQGTGITHAVLASTDIPVSMYSIFPYGGSNSRAPSGTVLLPISSFRQNYMVVTSWGGTNDLFGEGVLTSNPSRAQPGRPTLQIVAAEDGTSVSLLPKVPITGGRTVAPGAAGNIATFELQRGEILQLAQNQDLIGSLLQTSKPVGLFGGQTAMDVPVGVGYAEGDQKQIPPLSAWGHEYAVLPAPDRVQLKGQRTERSGELSIIRMLGAAPGTELVYEPRRPEGAPLALASGELARFFASEPFVVRSQDAAHAFYVDTLMVGMNGSRSGLGDPESVVSVPAEQWLDNYGFFADFSYLRSAVYVTRRKLNGIFQDVTLDCAGALTHWEPITAEYEWTYVELTRARNVQVYSVGTCGDGPHRIQSAGPFTMTMWGLDSAASYGYPGGMGLRRSTPLELPVH